MFWCYITKTIVNTNIKGLLAYVLFYKFYFIFLLYFIIIIIIIFFGGLLLYNNVVVFTIHWHESAMDLHVFPILIPPSAFLPIASLWVIPVHQPWTFVSYIQPGLLICFTLDSILVSVLFSQNIPPSPSPTESKSLFCTSVSLCFAYRVIVTIFLNSIYMC